MHLKRQGRCPMLSPENLESFLLFCKKVHRTGEKDRPLLLKNPFDTLNFVYMAKTLPKARFILIYRNPVEVIDSQLRTIRMMLGQRLEYDAMLDARYARALEQPWKLRLARTVYSDKLPLLLWQVSRNVARNCDYILRNVDELTGRAAAVTYPELCQEPDRVVRRLLRFVGTARRPGPSLHGHGACRANLSRTGSTTASSGHRVAQSRLLPTLRRLTNATPAFLLIFAFFRKIDRGQGQHPPQRLRGSEGGQRHIH